MKLRKVLALTLAIAMVLGTMSVPVFAEETSNVLGEADFETNEGVVFDGTNYYGSLADAVKAVHGIEDAILYCKPDADLGTMTHGHVCKNLTVYGNGATVTGEEGAERDFEIGFPTATGTDCTGIDGDITLKVYNLNGVGAWGLATNYAVNIYFEDCDEVNKIFIMNPTGEVNISLTNCSFTSNMNGDTAVYSNANGDIVLNNVDFSNVLKAVNLNHKATEGTQKISINECTFTDCGNDVSKDEIPVRVLSSEEGGVSILDVNNCSFSGTTAGGADVLLPYGAGDIAAKISETTANVTYYTSEEESADKAVADSETFTQASVVASIEDVYYASLQEAIDAAGEDDTITLLSPVTLTEETTWSKSVKLNGETLTTGGFLTIADGVSLAGDNITGTVYAEEDATVNVNIPNADLVSIGDITFSGDNVVRDFDTKDYYTTVNIGVDAYLDMKYSPRPGMGHGNVYNITGNITDAKTADKANLKPSLSANGVSFGDSVGIELNVKNAYIKFGSEQSASSKHSATNGTWNMTFENSIVEYGKDLFFAEPTVEGLNPAINFKLKDSVLTTGTNLKFMAPGCTTEIINSKVSVGSSIMNNGVLKITDNSEVTVDSYTSSSHGGNFDSIIVDNSTLKVDGTASNDKFIGEGTGAIELKNNAQVFIDYITDTAITVDASSCLTAQSVLGTSTIALTFDKVAHKKVLDLDETASREGNIILPAELPDGVELEYGTDGDVTVWPYVAQVGDTKYLSLKEALKAIYDNRNTEGYNNTLNILADETIDAYWDSRNSGSAACYATFTKPIKINGNGHTIKFTNTVYDAGNYMSAFRFEDDAEINGLTIDMSEALSGWGQRLRAISTKAGNLKIDGCTFIGNPDYNQTRAIIFGELGGDKNNADTLSELAAVGIEIKNSKFVDWSYGITDNENGNDVKTVTISGNEFEAANVQVSASETVTFSGNEMDNSGVTITSYADVNELSVVATDNTLDETATNYIKAAEIQADEGFKLPVAEINGKKYISLQEAVNKAADGDTIVVTSDISDEKVTVNGDVTITGAAPVATFALTAGNDITLTNVIFDVKKDASLSLDAVAVRGLSYIDADRPEAISVTNCDIDVTTKSAGIGCPPAFINFSNENGWENTSVVLTFVNNSLLVTSSNAATHGIAGWNTIESATITGNTFGSEAAPLSNAAVKLMNFVEGATVTVNNNNFYVNSKDAGYAPNAIQLFQNNSRGNNYKAVISANNFYVDDATAAIGINENAMGNPDSYPGNGQVAIGKDNTVNGRAIAIADILVFGNGIADIGRQDYVGLGVEYDENGKIIAGTFSEYSGALNEFLADGYVAVENPVSGWLEVGNEDAFANSIAVKFVKADVDDAGVDTLEGADEYYIVLEATSDIHEFASAEFTFANASELLNGEDMPYVITAADNMTLSTVAGKPNYYGFAMEGDKEYEISGKTITLGKVTFTGYGAVDFSVVEGIVNATTVLNNRVKTFEVNGAVSGDVTKGELVINTGKINGEDAVIAVPVRDLTINIDFPNAVENKSKAYQAMKVVISGGDLKENIEIELGEDAEVTELTIDGKVDAQHSVTYADNAYEVAVTDALTLNNAYTVTVSGAGYRTARYTVTMTEDKELNFWNNVMDNDTVVEEGKLSEKKNFLAGDIVKDNNINIYDLSAVVSYFGTEDCVNSYPDYAKYDLNRDGVIDSRDVAYVLVSWGE